MPGPSQIDERREELLPIVARAFAELGYRRTTTAELAQRCEVRENILYRTWPDKKTMFIASIDYIYEQAMRTWRALLLDDGGYTSGAMRLLSHEAEHHGETGLHRIIFAGLSETDDPEIREALRMMYQRFHRFIGEQLAAHREGGSGAPADEDVSAWAIVGLGLVSDIGRELGLFSDRARQRMIREVGPVLLDGTAK